MRQDQKLFEALKELENISGDSLTMCSPRRMSLEPVKVLRSAVLGEQYQKLVEFARKEYSGLEVLSEVMRDNQFLSSMAESGWNRGAIETCYAVIRHQEAKGPIYTVNEPLSLLLEDTGVKKNIPVRFLAAPKRTCYIEFEPPEFRRASDFIIYDDGRLSICEGCYIQERKFDVLPNMSSEDREGLELDPHKPTRLLYVGFTASPIHNKKNQSVQFDAMDYASLYIQDEDESLGDMLERNLKHIMNKRASIQLSSPRELDIFMDAYRRNFSRLFKVLFYLNVERRQQVTVNEASDLEKRMESVAEKKRGKLSRQLQRTYDRIVVGPQSYTPRHERIASGVLTPGTKAPHYRSGYFGIRWVGSGQAKMPELRRIPEVIVNKELLNDGVKVKDYEIRSP
ncbi:hypothetical protein V0M98_38685 (plasmid) [Pseudomonas silesiensis]|uniref:hypothetical protein n=1 Tax=Pseudomonas silesiensis TaxID=1853130 RepID=UPI0030CE9A21